MHQKRDVLASSALEMRRCEVLSVKEVLKALGFQPVSELFVKALINCQAHLSLLPPASLTPNRIFSEQPTDRHNYFYDHHHHQYGYHTDTFIRMQRKLHTKNYSKTNLEEQSSATNLINKGLSPGPRPLIEAA